MMTAKPRIGITITNGIAEVVVVGCLGHELGHDWFDAYDLDEIRRSARWLKVPPAVLYDLTLQARAGSAVAA
jgi:hypothetical protein